MITLISVICLTFCIIYYKMHPTHYKYNDSWIIGKSLEEIEERYGETDIEISGTKAKYIAEPFYTFDDENDTLKGYYVRTDDIILPTYQKYYYWIVFDENNIAVAVFYKGVLGT